MQPTPSRRPARQRRTRFVGRAAALALALPLLAVAPAPAVAPASNPDPAAPPGGCAVTQDVTRTWTSRPSDLSYRQAKVHDRAVKTRRTRDGQWAARVTTTATWKGRATVTSISAYASADCEVTERDVVATRTKVSTVKLEQRARSVRATRKGAVSAARALAKKKAGRIARRNVIWSAGDNAFLAARMSFLASLPTRPLAEPVVPRPLPTAKQACPTKLADGTEKDWQVSSQYGRTVPQFSDAAEIWVCTYSFVDGKVDSRRKLTAAQRTRMLAWLRGLTTLDPRMTIACTLAFGPTTLITHVSRDGVRTGVVRPGSGCGDVHLTPDAKRVPAGSTDSPGVPSGAYRAPFSL